MSAAEPSTASRSLSPRALYQEVAERLRQQIFARELEPGSWIDEQKLAAEYGISRTPLREALKVLAVEGLVTMKVRRGAYVTEMSADDVAQVYHLLGLLEADAAGEVARRASDAQLAELRRLHEQLEKQARNRDAFFALNEAFHLKLLEFAGNRWRTHCVALGQKGCAPMPQVRSKTSGSTSMAMSQRTPSHWPATRSNSPIIASCVAGLP